MDSSQSLERIRSAVGLMRGHLDPGVERVREFHLAFDAHVEPSPRLPELSDGDASLLASHAKALARHATILKQQAAEANGTGREALGLLLIRLQLMVEEVGEVADALAVGDLAHVLQELSDVSYVVDGTYLTLGLAVVKTAADIELHAANMSKLGHDGRPIIAPSGRVMKGPDTRAPDMRRVLEEAGA